MGRYENVNEMIFRAGYKSLNQFCKENGLTQPNEYRRLRDDKNVDIDILFNYANILHVSIDTVIKAFFEDKYIDNQQHINNN